MDLSIIIVNWNTRELLGACLDSIYHYPPDAAFEVFVIDNASSDDSPGMVRERFPQVHLIENRDNLGFARANNQGIRQSSGEYVLLLNSDTCVHPASLQKLLCHMRECPEVGLAGVRLLNTDGSLQTYSTDFPTLINQTALLWRLPGHQRFVIGRTRSDSACTVERVKGACLAIRRAALTAAGLMDESLFLYAEEDDLCFRLRRAGWQVTFIPDVVITHYGGASTEQIAGRALVYLYRGKLWFIEHHHGVGQARAFVAVLAVSCMARILAGTWAVWTGDLAAQIRGRAYLNLLRCLPGLLSEMPPPVNRPMISGFWERLWLRIHKLRTFTCYLRGDATPALVYLDALRRDASQLPICGRLGGLRGFSSQTVVTDIDIVPVPPGPLWHDQHLVLKFETNPGEISPGRLAGERRNAMLARSYLDRFMPPTLRVIGHGIAGRASAMTFQQRIDGKLLRKIRWSDICSNPHLQANLIAFCDAVIKMGCETGRIPDIAGTLPRVDHLTNFFWNSRNVMANPASGDVWLVDTGWKEGQELLRGGALRARLRTHVRLYTLRLFRWRLRRIHGQQPIDVQAL
jgi:N-acetylglucosaminyl-diphospho-decaprenol L-rhamnosyltransferase